MLLAAVKGKRKTAKTLKKENATVRARREELRLGKGK